MRATILDCYTDEPSGLGVPPYLGTYPRYLFGALAKENELHYLTVDDVRLLKKYNSIPWQPKAHQKTDITVHNLTKNYTHTREILNKTDVLIVICGIQTPGKYLSAVPATLKEAISLINGIPCKKILAGPAATSFGTGIRGGKFAESTSKDFFDEIDSNYLEIGNYKKVAAYAVKGAAIVSQLHLPFVAEIETGKGCKGKCSFCTEPLKNEMEFRDAKDIYLEIEALYAAGVRHFRYGKQTCFYSYQNGKTKEISKLLKPVRKNFPDIKVLHIDNVNPLNVIGKNGKGITKLIVQHCTEGNIAAFGVESFDCEVIKANSLNCTPEVAYEAAQIINHYGAYRGQNGMPKFLPGINLIFGLEHETKKTFEENYLWLKKMIDAGILLRRINIREAALYPGTKLHMAGGKTLRKNHKFYYTAREKIRQEIDFPMLQKLVPKGAIISDVRAEIYDGKTTFARQLGTYPLIIGIKGRLELDKFYSVEVTGHMLRSITGKVVTK